MKGVCERRKGGIEVVWEKGQVRRKERKRGIKKWLTHEGKGVTKIRDEGSTEKGQGKQGGRAEENNGRMVRK